MKMSQLFGQTLRDSPSDAEITSHRLLMRAGFIRPLGAGIYSYLHLARRAMTKIENILRDEMNAIGGQEITMPLVHPAEVWKETERWYQIGSEMGRFKDKNNHDMVLAMTHEEVVADLVRSEIQSYKQLPRLIYHIQTKWRDDQRPRAGLIRVREFTMKDSYSLDADWEGMDRQYRSHYQAYFNIFHRCGLPVTAIKSDNGLMGGKLAHEFIYPSPIGEDTLLLCTQCGYTANQQVAICMKTPPAEEKLKTLEKVSTPNCKSIEDLVKYLDMPRSKTAKAIFLMAKILDGKEVTEKLIFAVVRGDMSLNETKLANTVRARDLRMATDEEIRSVGVEPGYASPVNLASLLPEKSAGAGAIIVVDDLIPASPNLVAGANEKDYHLLNTNYGRDYESNIIADITSAEDGSSCPECGTTMKTSRGVEVGNIFKLGTRYSDSMGCTFLDKDGIKKPVIMGSYGIGIGRLLACVAEEHHDELGLIWPVTVAPFQVHIVVLRSKGDSKCEEFAEELYCDLQTAGIEVLDDDRDESPGVKFNDADLIGLPVRITISERALGEGGVEMKMRREQVKIIIPLKEVVSHVRMLIRSLQLDIDSNVIAVNYPDQRFNV